jgi:hypothetical protein
MEGNLQAVVPINSLVVSGVPQSSGQPAEATMARRLARSLRANNVVSRKAPEQIAT